MKDILHNKLNKLQKIEQRLFYMREFLQHCILSIFDRRGLFKHWAFLGGTALRVLFDLRRFSEDLDFSLIYGSGKVLTINDVVKMLNKDLSDWGFVVETGKIKEGSLQSCFLRFPGLLAEFDIAKNKRQKLSIKIEVDLKPPRGYLIESTPVQKDYFFNVVHYDLSSLFAGKMHALLYRGFVKGRDFYDLLWFLTKGVELNSRQLKNAILQTEGTAPELSWASLSEKLKDKIAAANFNDVVKDLAPFLEKPDEIRMINQEVLLKAAEKLRVKELQ